MTWNCGQMGVSSVLPVSGAKVFNLLKDTVNICLGFTAWNPVPSGSWDSFSNSCQKRSESFPQLELALYEGLSKWGETIQKPLSFGLPVAGNERGGWIPLDRGEQRTGNFMAHVSWHCHLVSSVLGRAGFRFVCQLKQKPALGLVVCNCIALKPSLQTLPEKVKFPEWSLHNCKLDKHFFIFLNVKVQAICAYPHLSRACWDTKPEAFKALLQGTVLH